MINDISGEKLDETARLLRDKGGEVETAIGSVSDRGFVRLMYARTVEFFGKLNIVVNNAAINKICNYEEISDDDFENIININLKSVFISCQEILPYFKENGGKIINIASAAGKRGGGGAGNAIYAASKGGVIALTKSVARETGKYNITANCVSPGFCETGIASTADPQKVEILLQGLPLGRKGTGDDIAKAVVFLSSDLSDYITGEIMDVDGGLMCD